MSYNIKRLPIRIDGAATLATGGICQVLLADALQQLSGIALGQSYLSSLLIEVDATFVGNGADVVGENHAHNVMRSLTFRLPGTDRPVYELPTYAGSRLRYWTHSIKGRRPRAANGGAGGNITPAGGGGTAVRLKYEIPCYLPGGERSRDLALPLAMLREAADIEIVWANLAAAGVFGANISVTGTVVRVTATLEERPEFVVPTPFAVQLISPGVAQGTLGVAGRVLHSVIEVAAQTDAVGEAVIADAARDEINLSVDGRIITERCDSRATTYAWNNEVAVSRDEEIPDPEAGTQNWLPWFFPHKPAAPTQLTKLPLCVARPEYRVTGTDTSPDLVVTSFDLNDRAAAVNRIARSNVAVPPGFRERPKSFLTNKSGSKQMVAGGADGAARLPVRLHMRPVTGPGLPGADD